MRSRHHRLSATLAAVALGGLLAAVAVPRPVAAIGLLALPDSYSVVHDRVLWVAAPGVLSNDVTLLGASANLQNDVSHGSLTLNADGSFRYAPDAGFVGTDSFTYYPSGLLATSVTLTVTDAVPTAVGDAYSTRAGTRLTVAAPGVLGNDMDDDGDALTAGLVTSVAHGTLSLSTTGGFTYQPAGGFVGTDFFSYRAWDGTRWSSSATVSLSVTAVLSTPTPTPKPTPSPTPSPSPILPSSTPGPSSAPASASPLAPGATPASSSSVTASVAPAGGRAVGSSTPSSAATQPTSSATPAPEGAGAPAPSGDPGAAAPPSDPVAVGAGGLGVRTGGGATDQLDLPLFGAVGLGELWYVPAVVVAGPGLLVVVWVLLQLAAGAAWLPATRRIRGQERKLPG